MKQNYVHPVLLSATLGLGVIGSVCYYLSTLGKNATDLKTISYACLGASVVLSGEYLIMAWQNENRAVFSYSQLILAVMAISLSGANLLVWHSELVTSVSVMLVLLSLALQVVKQTLTSKIKMAKINQLIKLINN